VLAQVHGIGLGSHAVSGGYGFADLFELFFAPVNQQQAITALSQLGSKT